MLRRIDELHLELPFYGSRRMTFELNKEGRGGSTASGAAADAGDGDRGAGSAPRHEQAAPGHKIYPYLLRGLEDCRAEPRGRRDLHPDGVRLALSDGAISRARGADSGMRVCRTPTLPASSPAQQALEEALLRFGKPRIFNTDQGSTFTAEAFTSSL